MTRTDTCRLLSSAGAPAAVGREVRTRNYNANPAGQELFLADSLRAVLEMMAPIGYDEMRRQWLGFWPVRLGVRYMSREACRLLEGYTHPDERVQASVMNLLWPVIKSSLADIMAMLQYWGCVLAEPKGWRVVDGLPVPRTITAADPYLWWQVGMPQRDALTNEVSTWRLLTGKDAQFFDDDERQRLLAEGAESGAWRDIEARTPLGARRVIYANYGSLSDNAWGEGVGVVTSPSWAVMREAWPSEAVATFKNAIANLIILSNRSGSDLSALMGEVTQQAAQGSVVVLNKESVGGPESIIPLTPMPERTAFGELIHRHTAIGLLACDIPPTMLLETSHGQGTKSSSQVHADYNVTAKFSLAELAANIALEQIITPWVTQVFGPAASVGEDRVLLGAASPMTVAEKAALLSALTTGGWLDPTDGEARETVEDLTGLVLGDYNADAGLPSLGLERRTGPQQPFMAEPGDDAEEEGDA